MTVQARTTEIEAHHTALRSVLRSVPRVMAEVSDVERRDPRVKASLQKLEGLVEELADMIDGELAALPAPAAPVVAKPGRVFS